MRLAMRPFVFSQLQTSKTSFKHWYLFHVHVFHLAITGCIALTSSSGLFTSPNYPNNYNNNDNVCWTITVPAGYVTWLTFSQFITEANYDVVRVYDGTSTNSPLLLFASGNAIPPAITSSSNRMLAVFTSDSSAVLQGFQANFIMISPTTSVIRTFKSLFRDLHGM